MLEASVSSKKSTRQSSSSGEIKGHQYGKEDSLSLSPLCTVFASQSINILEGVHERMKRNDSPRNKLEVPIVASSICSVRSDVKLFDDFREVFNQTEHQNL
mmetsp:Transcript_40471/g.46405  ORF Transcript_40471/g.46405 Transcript_40471/m.46405 type:complete len:101 (-) Transcript_40471:177-479(-)